MRAFVGLPIGAHPPLVRALRALDETGADVRTVPPEHLHVTLAFLGDVPEEAAATLARALDEATAGQPPGALALRGLGAFPTTDAPRVVWAGVADAGPPTALAKAVRARLGAAGFPGDPKPFRAHATLARTRSARGRDALASHLRAHATTGFGEVPLDEVRLYRSTLSPKGARHETLHRATLGGAA